MNIIKFETPDLNEQEKLDIPVIISRFLEKVAEENKLDVQDVMMWYDRRSGVLEVIERRQPPVVLGVIEVNDL
jgi:hypothetical protein